MVAIGWALFLFRPWSELPFESQDFNELLPSLRAGASFAERQELMGTYMATQGRYIPLTLAYINVKWTLLGWNAPAWQWANVVLMLLNLGLVYRFARRVGASRGGSAAAAACFIVGTSTAALWPRVHYGEPVGLPFLLGAAFLAANANRGRRIVARTIAVAALMSVAILVKETFVAALPFIVLLAACHDGEGGWHAPTISRRIVAFALTVGAACVAALVPVLLVKLSAPATSYVAYYGAESVGARNVAATFRVMLLPTSDSIRRWFPELVFCTVVSLGLWARARYHVYEGTVWLLLSALSLPLAGAVVHAPWPLYSPRYASGYALGIAMLLAIAVTCVTYLRRQVRIAAYAMLAFLAVYGTLRTREEVDNFFQTRVAHAGVARAVTELRTESSAGRIVVPSAVPEPPRFCMTCWLVDAHAQSLFAVDLPKAESVTCEQAERVLAGGERIVVAALATECPAIESALGPPRRSVLHLVTHRYVGRPGPVDSTRTLVWLAGGTR